MTGHDARLQELAPGFIVAMPQLDDPNFHRTVVLMLKHGDEGAFGLVINRPGELGVGELMRDQEIPFGGDEAARIMVGGPVEFGRHLLVLHGEPQGAPSAPSAGTPEAAPSAPSAGTPQTAPEGMLEVSGGIYLITNRETLARLSGAGTRTLRCYVGYAGWGPGQLEQELSEGAWVALPPDPRLVFDELPDAVWERALRAAGIDPATLVPGADIN